MLRRSRLFFPAVASKSSKYSSTHHHNHQNQRGAPNRKAASSNSSSSSSSSLKIEKEVVAVFKPSHVPLFSPLQALHDTFDIQTDKNDSITNRVLHSELKVKKQKTQSKKDENIEEKSTLFDGDEEIVRFDQPTSSSTSSSSSNRNQGIVPEALLSSRKNDSSHINNNSSSTTSSSSSENAMNMKHQEVRFPLPTSDWFSEGVTLAARTPSSFAFLLHSACVGAVRREYHALCRIPKHIARSLNDDKNNNNTRNQSSFRKNKDSSTASEQLVTTDGRNEDDNDSGNNFLMLNPHVKKFMELKEQEQMKSVITSHDEEYNNSNNNSSVSILSKPISSSGLFHKKEDFLAKTNNTTNNNINRSVISYALASSGWIRGATARLSDLVQSKNYRPEIDDLFSRSNNNNNKDKKVNHHYWTIRNPHPFVRQTDILAPAKPSLLSTVASASHIDFEFVVEEDGFILHHDLRRRKREQEDEEEAIVHLKLNVLGLQTESSIRCALAAAGFPVVDDFEYDHEVAFGLNEMFSTFTTMNPHQHFFENSPKNFKKQDTGRILRPLAVDYNRMLTPVEMMIRNQMLEESERRFFLMNNSDIQNNNSKSSSTTQPKLFCSKIVYPVPTSDRNIGILRHMLGASMTTRELVKKATKRVPTQDTTHQFICQIAEAPNLPPEYNLRRKFQQQRKEISSEEEEPEDLRPSNFAFVPGQGKRRKNANLWANDDEKSAEQEEATLLKSQQIKVSSPDNIMSGDTVATNNINKETAGCQYRPLGDENNSSLDSAFEDDENDSMKFDISAQYRRQRDAALMNTANYSNTLRNTNSSSSSSSSSMNSFTSNNDEDLGARQIILEQIRAASEVNEQNDYRKRGGSSSAMMGKRNVPRLHENSNNNNSSQRKKQMRCRYCFGNHPVSHCPKLGKK